MAEVEKVLEKKLCIIASVDKCNLALCYYECGTMDAVIILSRLQEVYHAKGKKVVYVFSGPSESF